MKLSLKWDHYQLSCLAGEGSSSIRSLLGEDKQGVGLSPEHRLMHKCSQCIYINLLESTLASAKTWQELGSSLRVLSDRLTPWERFMSATDGWKQH